MLLRKATFCYIAVRVGGVSTIRRKHTPHEVDELLSRVTEIEDLVRFPSVIGHFASAKSLAMLIARHAPTESVANLATQLASEFDALEEPELPLSTNDVLLNKLLWKLRRALEQAKKEFPRRH